MQIVVGERSSYLLHDYYAIERLWLRVSSRLAMGAAFSVSTFLELLLLKLFLLHEDPIVCVR